MKKTNSGKQKCPHFITRVTNFALWTDYGVNNKGNKAPFYNIDSVGFQLDPEMDYELW